MNDELTPSERAALRARIVGGAHDIKPVGAHRNAWIAGSVAAAMVVAIAGGVAVTSTLSAPEIATTPSPTVTTTTTPIPIPAPTSAPTPTMSPTTVLQALAFGGECSVVLDDETVSEFFGVPMKPGTNLLGGARVLGGVSCTWIPVSAGEGVPVTMTVVPWEAVPDSVRQEVGLVPPCVGGSVCSYSERHGDAWVNAESDDVEGAAAAVQNIGPRAAETPGIARALSSDAWSIPDCESEVLPAVREALGRDDIGPIQTDYFPHGQAWDVLTSNGAAGWCGFSGHSEDVSTLFTMDLTFWPGGTLDEDAAAGDDRRQSFPLAGGVSGWLYPENPPNVASELDAAARGGVLNVRGRGLDDAQMRAMVEAVLTELG